MSEVLEKTFLDTFPEVLLDRGIMSACEFLFQNKNHMIDTGREYINLFYYIEGVIWNLMTPARMKTTTIKTPQEMIQTVKVRRVRALHELMSHTCLCPTRVYVQQAPIEDTATLTNELTTHVSVGDTCQHLHGPLSHGLMAHVPMDTRVHVTRVCVVVPDKLSFS